MCVLKSNSPVKVWNVLMMTCDIMGIGQPNFAYWFQPGKCFYEMSRTKPQSHPTKYLMNIDDHRSRSISFH